MIFPDMGFLIAQKYKCVVVLLTRYGISKTFFPLHRAPAESINRLMCLGYVNNNHFMQLNLYLIFNLYLVLSLLVCNNHIRLYYVQIYLNDDCPIPPTCVLWERHRQQDASDWEFRYFSRMVRYNELISAHVWWKEEEWESSNDSHRGWLWEFYYRVTKNIFLYYMFWFHTREWILLKEVANIITLLCQLCGL